jgi:hypothetical protein
MSLVSGALIFSLGPYPVWTQEADSEVIDESDIEAAIKV